jgi:MFS superfamily sulfate permease-like transporter
LVVFLVALPLCLGIALASNAPLSSGLLAGIIGGMVVGALSGSHISVSGPAAGLAVIVASSIKELGSFDIFTLAVFLSGLFQVVFSLLRGGAIGNFFPASVIKGMLAAIGIILILKQFPHAIGYDVDFMGDEAFTEIDGENTFTRIAYAFRSIHPGAVIVSLFSFIIMLGFERGAKKYKFFQVIPGALVAVLVAVALNEAFKLMNPVLVIDGSHLVQLPFLGGISNFVEGFRLPQWSALGVGKVYSVALTIAIVGSLESLLSVDAADKLDDTGRVTNKDRELLAQGVANTLSGLVGGLPITAVIVRTSANVAAGGRTMLSAFLHGIWLMVCVIAIPHLLNLIPLSVLASILILVGFKLTKPALYRQMISRGTNQYIPFLVTIIAILFTDLLMGIIIGLMVGFFFVFRSNVHKSIVMVNEGSDYLIRFHKDVSFLQKMTLMQLLDQIPPNSSVMVDGSSGVFVDDDIVEQIEDFMKRSGGANITVALKKSSLATSTFFRESN